MIEYIGDPADTALTDYQPELRMMFKHAGENDRHQGQRHIHLKACDGCRKGGAADFGFHLPKVRERAANRMQMHR